jgi:hypothetical protein
VKILIPSCKREDELAPMLADIRRTAPDSQIVVSCSPDSAAVNRNRCLAFLEVGEIAIMVDDDIEGFYPGWVDELAAPLLRDPFVVMASARLLKRDGTFNHTCSDNYDSEPNEIEIFPHNNSILPTAAVALRKLKDVRFDEALRGSGFDDDDLCRQYIYSYPSSRFLQLNAPKLIHVNERKNQTGKYWEHNSRYFRRKWRGKF